MKKYCGNFSTQLIIGEENTHYACTCAKDNRTWYYCGKTPLDNVVCTKCQEAEEMPENKNEKE